MQTTPVFPEHFSTKEIAEALGISRQAVAQKAKGLAWKSVGRSGQGGGKCWNFDSLDDATKQRVFKRFRKVFRSEEDARREAELAETMQQNYLRKTDKARARAQKRYDLLLQTMRYYDSGMEITKAFNTVGFSNNVNQSTIRNWYYGTTRKGGTKKEGVRLLPRSLWLYALVDNYVGRTARAAFSEQAKEFLKSLYLHKKKPTLADSIRRTEEAAPLHGWILPSGRTMYRVIDALDPNQVAWVRGENRDFRTVMPPQTRDHTCFASGQAINGDGLRLSMYVTFEDGEVVENPSVWVWQDIRSSKLLSWKLGKSESTDIVRLSMYTLLGGIKPQYAWADNTRAAANKLVTGLAENRHRFKNLETDAPGLAQLCGINFRFTNPDHEMSSPGSKPVERAFGVGGLHETILVNPLIRDLGSLKKPVPVALLLEVIAEEVARFNARDKRRGMGMDGKSCDQVYAENFSPVQDMLSPWMRDLWLMNRETVTVRKDGLIAISAGRGQGKNEYWSETSSRHTRESVSVYYDPEDLTKPLHMFNLDGSYVGTADYKPSVAFISKEDGKKYAKARASRLKAEKKAAKDLITMTTMETQQFAHKATTATEPVAETVRTQLGDPEINMMIKDQKSDSYVQSHENVRKRIAALG